MLHRPVELAALTGQVQPGIEISHAADVLHFYYNRRLERFRIFRAENANRYKIETLSLVGPVAQRLEQRTHNPLVVGSNPTGPTTYLIESCSISRIYCIGINLHKQAR